MTEAITIRIPRSVAYAVLAALLALAVMGLGTWMTRGEGAARDHAQRYLSALAQEDAATAWSLLSHRTQTIWGSYRTFEGEIRAADWSSFQFEVVAARCDDGVCGVSLRIPNGVDSAPLMLHQGPTHFWWGSGDTLVFTDKWITDGTQVARERGDTLATITVVYGLLPWDDRGIT